MTPRLTRLQLPVWKIQKKLGKCFFRAFNPLTPISLAHSFAGYQQATNSAGDHHFQGKCPLSTSPFLIFFVFPVLAPAFCRSVCRVLVTVYVRFFIFIFGHYVPEDVGYIRWEQKYKTRYCGKKVNGMFKLFIKPFFQKSQWRDFPFITQQFFLSIFPLPYRKKQYPPHKNKQKKRKKTNKASA